MTSRIFDQDFLNSVIEYANKITGGKHTSAKCRFDQFMVLGEVKIDLNFAENGRMVLKLQDKITNEIVYKTIVKKDADTWGIITSRSEHYDYFHNIDGIQ